MKLVLLGDPVEHSRSPVIHTAALLAAGIEGTYEARLVDRAGLAEAIAEVRYGALDGANVTIPYKEAAFNLVDRVSEDSLRAGAVNTVGHGDGMAMGANTDIVGIRSVWNDESFPADAPVLVLGSGGAAAGALIALSDHAVSMAARSAEAAEALLRRTRVDGEVVAWGSAVDGAVVVNATPLGMMGESLPSGIVESSAGFIDLPYAESPTPAMLKAASIGVPAVDGYAVLVAQAAASFELWTAVPAPLDVMRKALDREPLR